MEKILILGDDENYWKEKLTNLKGVEFINPENYLEAEIIFGHENDFSGLDLKRLARLKWVQLFSAGFSTKLIEQISPNCILTTSKGIHGQAMFEYVLHGLLHLNNKVTFDTDSFINWERHRRNLLLQPGKKILLLGIGNIGAYLAKKFASLGLSVDAFANNIRKVKGVSKVYSSLNDVVLDSYSIVISSLPLTDDTHLIVDKSFLNKMSNDSVFINVGRGGTVDESALANALRTRQIKGAILDTFSCEPISKDFLLADVDNCLCSPHVSGYFLGSHDIFISKFEGLLDLYRTGSLQSELNGKY